MYLTGRSWETLLIIDVPAPPEVTGSMAPKSNSRGGSGFLLSLFVASGTFSTSADDAGPVCVTEDRASSSLVESGLRLSA